MACVGSKYFIGQGQLYIRPRADGCGDPVGSFRPLGDVSNFTFSLNPTYGMRMENTSGSRRVAARWTQGVDSDFSLEMRNVSKDNLILALGAIDSGSVAAGSVADETHTVTEAGWIFLEYQGVSNVVVETGGSPATLTLGTDYNINAKDGGIQITDTGYSNVVGDEISVSYDHVQREYALQGLQVPLRDYELYFPAINLTEPNSPFVVRIPRANIGISEELTWINEAEDTIALSLSGKMLPISEGSTDNAYFEIIESAEFIPTP